MKKSKIIKLLISAGLVLSIVFGMFIGGVIGSKRVQGVNMPHTVVTEQVKDKTVNYKEIITDGLKDCNGLRVIQSSLREEVKIKNSQYDNKLFKNNNIITAKGTGNYYLDLGNLKDNVIVKGNTVYIIGQINVEITLNEEGTTIDNVKGLFSFYNKKIEAEEYNNILVNIKGMMLSKAKEQDYIDTAKEKAEDSVRDIINTLDQDNNLNIKFIWK